MDALLDLLPLLLPFLRALVVYIENLEQRGNRVDAPAPRTPSPAPTTQTIDTAAAFGEPPFTPSVSTISVAG